MRSKNLFLAGALAGVSAFALTSTLLHRPAEPVQAIQPVYPVAQDARPPIGPGPAADLQEYGEAKPAALAPSHSDVGSDAPESGVDSEWDALVGGMLEWEVERRTGRTISAEQRARLLAELGALRDASLALQEVPGDPGDPAELRERLTRTLALVQVDATFRRELGVGVADFLEGLDPGAVDDVSSKTGHP